MRFLHTSDLHIGKSIGTRIDPSTGYNLRILDYLKNLDYLVNYAISNKVDYVLIAGDVYDTAAPPIKLQLEFIRRIQELEKHHIKTIVLAGNHDQPSDKSKAHSLAILKEASIGIILDEPKVVSLDCSLNIGAVPSTFMLKDPTRDAYEKVLIELSKLQGNKILMFHGAIQGCLVQNNKKLNGLILDHDALNKIDYVCLGDIHKAQRLPKENACPIVYSGSLMRTNFGEENEEKGFMDVSIGESPSIDFVKVPDRKFKTLNIDITKEQSNNPKVILDATPEDIIRIRMKLHSGQEPLFDQSQLNSLFSYQIEYEFVSEKGEQIIATEMPIEQLEKEYFKVIKDGDQLLNKVDLLKTKDYEEIVEKYKC